MAEASDRNNNGGSARIVDIAERCGVSVATVCRALQGNSRQSPATIERVVAMAKEMGYDPSRGRAGRRLVAHRSDKPMINHAIGMMSVHGGPRLSNYFLKILQGVLHAAGETDFEVQITNDWRILNRQELPIAYRSGDMDGVLTGLEEPYWTGIHDILRREPGFGRRPIVNTVAHFHDSSSVHVDNYAVGRMVMSHLLDLGHKHILHFVTPEVSETSPHGLRLAGFRDELLDRGLDPDSSMVCDMWQFGDEYVQSSSRSFMETIRRRPEVTAIIARHDQQAVPVYDALVTAGFRIPEDISIVGCDDTDAVIDDARQNILTTVRLPLVEIGQEATNLLIRRILGEETEDRDIVMPVELVARRSTATPRKAGGRTAASG